MRCPTLAELPPPPPGKTGWPWTEESPQVSETMPDGFSWPRVSVVTPSYNQGQFIEETIRSVLLQGYSNLEYIVIDGGSTDNSVEIIKKYESWLTYWISEPDRGQSHAINKGWERSNGEIVAWINSDDTYNPNAIRCAVEALESNSSIDMIYSDMNYIGASGKIIRRIRSQPYKFYKLLLNNYITQSTVFIRRDILDTVGILDETFHLIMDQDLWLRIGRSKKALYLPNAVLANLRIYPETKSNRKKVDRYAEGLRLLDKIFSDQTLPASVKRLRQKEYGRCYMHIAKALYANEHFNEIMPWLVRAVTTYPNQFRSQWSLCIRMLARILLGKSGTRSIRFLCNLVRGDRKAST